jgi:hypothetical protein
MAYDVSRVISVMVWDEVGGVANIYPYTSTLLLDRVSQKDYVAMN